jgi:hypothetical protein
MPNRMLQKIGFPLEKTYLGRSSALSIRTELNRYVITREVAEQYLAETGDAVARPASGIVLAPSRSARPGAAAPAPMTARRAGPWAACGIAPKRSSNLSRR